MGISERLAWAIEDAKTNATRLATLSGVPQPTIFRILTGRSKDPRTSNIEALARALCVDVRWLHHGIGSPKLFGEEEASKTSVLSPGELQSLSGAERRLLELYRSTSDGGRSILDAACSAVENLNYMTKPAYKSRHP